MNSKILISLVPGLFFAGTVQAAGAVMTFEEMDTDANGYITPAEAEASHEIASKFKDIDTNGDGKLNVTEYQAYMGKGRMSPPEEMETPEPGAAPY